MLKHIVLWCGAGDNFTACIALDNKATNSDSVISQRVYTCGANDCGQLGLGGTFTSERLNGGTCRNIYSSTVCIYVTVCACMCAMYVCVYICLCVLLVYM